MSSLFRKEAVEHQKENFFGDVLLVQPLSTTVLSACAALTGLLIMLFLFVGTYTPKQTVQGYLVPDKGLSKIVAPSLVTIGDIKVKEDDLVQRGDVLLTASSTHAQETGEDVEVAVKKELMTTRRALESKKTNEVSLFALQKKQLLNERQASDAEIEQLQKQIARQNEREQLAHERQEGAKSLVDAGNLSHTGYDEVYEAWLASQQQLDDSKRQLAAKALQIETLDKDIQELPLQHASRMTDISNAISDITQRLADLSSRHSIVIKAPFDGNVTAVQVYPGQSVSAGALLLAVLPEGSILHADLYVPTRAIGFVKPGQVVRVRYGAFPYEKFGIYSGKIASVSKTILLPSELPIPVTLNEPVYRITVALDAQAIEGYGQLFQLQPGMLLEADLMLEKRTLIEWVLSPLYYFKGRV